MLLRCPVASLVPGRSRRLTPATGHVILPSLRPTGLRDRRLRRGTAGTAAALPHGQHPRTVAPSVARPAGSRRGDAAAACRWWWGCFPASTRCRRPGHRRGPEVADRGLGRRRPARGGAASGRRSLHPCGARLPRDATPLVLWRGSRGVWGKDVATEVANSTSGVIEAQARDASKPPTLTAGSAETSPRLTPVLPRLCTRAPRVHEERIGLQDQG